MTLLLSVFAGKCQVSIGTSLMQHPNFDHTSALLTALGLLLSLEIHEPQSASDPSPSLAARALPPPPVISFNTTHDGSASATRSSGMAGGNVTAPAPLFCVSDGKRPNHHHIAMLSCLPCLQPSQHDCMKCTEMQIVTHHHHI